MSSDDEIQIDQPERPARRGNNGGGRRKYQPTPKERAQVKAMAGFGLKHEEICTIIGISPPVLRRCFRHELDTGAPEANAQVGQSLFRQATHPTKPNVIAAIFWLKCRAGWRDHDSAASLGKKELQAEEAKKVTEGARFAPGAAPPALRVVK